MAGTKQIHLFLKPKGQLAVECEHSQEPSLDLSPPAQPAKAIYCLGGKALFVGDRIPHP